MDRPPLKARDIEALAYIYSPVGRIEPSAVARRRRWFHMNPAVLAVTAVLLVFGTLAWLLSPR